MDTVQELQVLRAELIREIDDRITCMIQSLKEDQNRAIEHENRRRREKEYESIFPLNADTGIFKGRRPTGVIFEDGTREDVPTWKRVFEEIMKRCNSDVERHKALMELRGKVLGRNRVLLGSEKGKMRSPLKIDRALYAETHYDTETLLKILVTRILEAVGYDYSGIRIAVQNE